MNDPAPLNDIDRCILDALKQGEKTGGDLLDATQLKDYSTLNNVLKSLSDRGYITMHFHDLNFRVYRLALENQPDRFNWFRSQ